MNLGLKEEKFFQNIGLAEKWITDRAGTKWR